MTAEQENVLEGHRSASPEPGLLRIVSRLSSYLNRTAAAIAAVILVLMVTLILVEIVLRLFSLSTFMADALVGRGVAAITFLAMGWTLEQGSMIRIQVVTSLLPPRLRGVVAGFAMIATEALVLWLIWYQYRTFARLWARGTTTEHHLPIPLWIPEGIFLVGLCLLALSLLVLFLRLLVHGGDSDSEALRL